MRTLRRLGDETGIVLDWLIKVTVALIVVGVVAVELVSVILVRATAADTASKAAQEAGFTYRDTRSEKRAAETAEEIVEAEGADMVGFAVDEKNDLTRVTVRKKAKTIFIHNINAFKKYTTVTESQTSPIP